MWLSIEKIPYGRQWLAGLSLSLGTLVVGTTAGWASPYVAKLTAPDSTDSPKMTSSEASWTVSLLYLGQVLGAVLGGLIQESLQAIYFGALCLVDYLGRKKTLLLTSLPLVVGWALMTIAPTVRYLYTSRVLTGFAMGMRASASSSFLGEIADPMIRGSLISLKGNSFSVGALLGTIMGGLLPMEVFSYVCLAVTGLFVVSFAFVPESPYYHVSNGDTQKAEESLKWYNKDVDVKGKTRELQDFLGCTSASVARRFHEFKKPEHRKNLLVLLAISSFALCAGLKSTDSYAEIILIKSKVELTPSVVVMALSFSEIVGGTLALVLVDKFGRRVLMMASGAGLGTGHVLLGFHFHMLSSGIDPKSINWLPVLSLFLVYFSIPCGLTTVSQTLQGELFPPILKTPACFVISAFDSTMSFAITKCFQPYLDLVSEKYVFWTFAISAMSSVLFSYFYVPETLRISLIDIQVNLKEHSKNKELVDEKLENNIRVNV